MAEQTQRERARNASERAYTTALPATAAMVVLPIFAGLAYPDSMERIDGGAPPLFAGVILGYILNAAWRQK